ncbi:MAG: hypothetical protein EA407_09340 [Rhodobacteraceae bacterium]|nr:MAG: hypothetical protein EA407_09340 [Paracoccaceae bacterium]
MRFLTGCLVAMVLSQPGQAQNFTTQAEVQPILEMTRAHWIGLSTQSGQDLLYFTHLMAYRCGLEAIYMGVNGNEPIIRVLMEPCHHELRTPNAIRVPPILGFTADALQSVSIRITFPDGQELSEEFPRAEIRLD